MEDRLSELPKGWVWTTLNEVTDYIENVNPKINPDKEFIYLDIASIDNSQQKITDPKKYFGIDAPSRARQLVKSGDILFSTVRTYLRNIAVVSKIYDGQIASTGFCVIRPLPKIQNRLIFWLVQTDDFLNPLNQLQRGTSYPAVRDSDVFPQIIPLPPLPEQHRIVAKIEELFTRLDAGVEALKKIKAQLKRYRQAVLKYAFEGKLTEEWRDANKDKIEPASALLERIREQRKKEGKGRVEELPSVETSKLAKLPEGWEWARVGVIGRVMGGKRLPKGHVYSETPTNYPYIRVTDFENMTVNMNNLLFLKPETQKLICRYTISKEDIYISIAGSIGKVGVVPDQLDCANLTENAAKITGLNNIDKKFLSYSLNSTFSQEQISRLTISSNQPKLALFSPSSTVVGEKIGG